jgi:type II secretory pathway pseudopilin PulG
VKIFLLCAVAAAIATALLGLALYAQLAGRGGNLLTDFWMPVYSSLVVGVLVGLALTGVQTWLNASDERQKALAERSQVRTRLAVLADAELEANESILQRAAKADGDTLLTLLVREPLSTSFWESVSNTGDTRSIEDLDALMTVGSAYERVRITRGWQDRIADGFAGSASAMTVGKRPLLDILVSDARRTVGPAIEAISVARGTLAEIKDK